MTVDLEISGEKSAGSEEQSAVGEEQYADVDIPSLEDSTKNCNKRHSVRKKARIEHPEVLVVRSSGHRCSREREREKLPLIVTANWEISGEKSSGGEDQSTVGEEQCADVDLPSLEDPTKNFNGRHSVGERAKVEHSEVLVMRSSGHRHSRETVREKLPLTVTADLEISGEKLAGDEERLAVGEEQYADVDVPSLEDSTKNCNGRDPVGKRARIEHPEVLVISFDVPFSLECKGCESVIVKDVRVNAEKKLVGNYHGKKIWSFSFECVYCGRKIVMERLSNERKYEVVRGARRKGAKHQGTTKEAVNRRDLQLSELPWGYFPNRDLENRFPFYPLYGLVNVKARDDYLKAPR